MSLFSNSAFPRRSHTDGFSLQGDLSPGVSLETLELLKPGLFYLQLLSPQTKNNAEVLEVLMTSHGCLTFKCCCMFYHRGLRVLAHRLKLLKRKKIIVGKKYCYDIR